MSLSFDKEYVVQWSASKWGEWYDAGDDTFETIEEAREELERNRRSSPGTDWRIASRYVSEWEPVEGGAEC